MASLGSFSGITGVTEAVQGLAASMEKLAAATPTSSFRTPTERNKEFSDRQVGMLQRLLDDAGKLFPTDSGWDKIIRESIKQELDNVLGGKEKIGDALSNLQKVLGNFYNAFQQQFFGSQDAQVRELLAELQRFILSGAI